jgi:hypothetical protein
VPAPPGIVVQLGRALRSDLVGTLVAAGIRVETVMPRHSLEAAFLEMVGPNGCPPVELLGELLSALPAPMVGAAEGTAGAAEGTAGAAEGMVGAAEGMVGAAEGMPAQGDRT